MPSLFVSRRTFLLGAAGAAALAGAGCAPGGDPAPGASSSATPRGDLFALGVASGDPTPDGAVLWTRLARDPLADDGMGGIPARSFPVQWEVAEDERFTKVVQRGDATAAPEAGHSVHVELAGLRPGREYFYRFRAEGALSQTGRTHTTPEPGSMTPLAMAFASCSQYEHGYFTAYRHLAEERPHLILHLGDYQYEYEAGGYELKTGNVRDHRGPETVTLANYRQRYAQYKSDPDLQLAHAAAPWVAVWDDHEVDNNWAGEVYEKPEKPQPDFLERRRAAFQAYYENMPLRRAQVPNRLSLRLFRRVQWGDLATFHMLDTRQYRDDQVGNDKVPATDPENRNPARSLTGAEQERWLLDGLHASRARWDVLGQQVMFAPIDYDPTEAAGYNPDAWDGYVGSRDRVMDGWQAAGTRNPVVLTGDVHTHYANDIRRGDAVVASELTATSITSGGDGSAEHSEKEKAQLRDNPHIRLLRNQRGYISTRITPESIRADYRVLPYVSKPGAPVETAASFDIRDGVRGLQQV